jgi:hypothetical protein
MQAPPEPKHTPPKPMQQCNTGMQQKAKNCSTCPGRLDRLHWAVTPPASDLTAWGRLDRPKRPTLHQTAQKLPELIGTHSKHSQVLKACTNSPCWQCVNQGKMRKFTTYNFSNIQNSSQEATQVQIRKLDTLPLDKAKKDLSNFAKSYSLISKNLNMSKTCQNGKATKTSC